MEEAKLSDDSKGTGKDVVEDGEALAPDIVPSSSFQQIPTH